MRDATMLAGLLALLTVIPVAAAAGPSPLDPGQAAQAAGGQPAGQAGKAAEGTAKAGDAAQAPERPAAAAKPAAAKPNALTRNQYEGGFRVTTDDGRFSLRIMGAVQMRYSYIRYDDNVSQADENYSNFFLRRARLWFDGHAYDPRFTYVFHLQLEPMSAVNLHDAWINYAIKPMFQVGAGRNKIAYGLEFVNSGFGNNFVDRSILSGETDISSGGGLSRWPGGGTEGFNVSSEDAYTGFPTAGLILFRSQGVQVSGKSGEKGRVFEYQAGIWQGRNTKGASNPDANHLYSIRAGFYPNGAINWLLAGDVADTRTFKTGLIVSAYHDASQRTANYAGATVPRYKTRDRGYDLAFLARYRGFSADLEWAHETYTLEDETLVGDNEFGRAAWRAQLGYFIKPKVVEVVGRYAENQRLEDGTPEAARNSGLGLASVKNEAGELTPAVEGKLTEWTFGVNYYLSGAGHQHKIFADYSRLSRDFAGFVGPDLALTGSVPQQDINRLRVMLQLKF